MRERTESELRSQRVRARAWCSALIGSLLLASAVGCGDDDYGPYEIVGGQCRSNAECAPGADCQRGGDFPDGTCTLPCNSHIDCTAGTACIDTQGGICLVACANDSYCRAGYKCKTKHDRDGRGDSLVCIK
jgi:hypothetical protein